MSNNIKKKYRGPYENSIKNKKIPSIYDNKPIIINKTDPEGRTEKCPKCGTKCYLIEIDFEDNNLTFYKKAKLLKTIQWLCDGHPMKKKYIRMLSKLNNKATITYKKTGKKI